MFKSKLGTVPIYPQGMPVGLRNQIKGGLETRPYNRKSRMLFNPDNHHRRSIRLRNYDYAQAGAYFVTICTWQRECLFGEIVEGEMALNELGSMAGAAWADLPNHYRHVELDTFVIMPSHIHGIIVFSDEQAEETGLHEGRVGNPPLREKMRHGLPEIVRGFKTFSSWRINAIRHNHGCPIWQRNYYDRVIRNENELTRARSYIVNNPLKWEHDKENPMNSM